MAINQAYPSLNDIEPSWADIGITAVFDSSPLADMSAVAGIKWGRKVDVGVRRGPSGGRVMARTTGQGDQTASATFYRSGLRTMIKSLMSEATKNGLVRGNQVLISLVSFNIHIQYTPPGETEIYDTIIKGCRYLGDDNDVKEGADPDKVEVTLNPIEIADLINGQEVVLL